MQSCGDTAEYNQQTGMKYPEVTIRGSPGVVLARVAPTLLSLFGADSIVLGGGTVLAARWNHRVSTDIDLFTNLEHYQDRVADRRETVASTLCRLLSDAADGAVEVERGWLRIHFPEGPAALMTIPRPTIRDPHPEIAAGTDIRTESTAEILARKLQSRMLDLGVLTDRDLYDLLVARERDPVALRRVLTSVTDAERAAIASELRSLPGNWSSGEPVRDPAYPDLLRGLALQARRLFESDPASIGANEHRR